MEVVKYPQELTVDENAYKYSRDYQEFSVYLAGAMNDWRDTVIKSFEGYNNIIFIDPSVDNYNNLTEDELKKHREWELKTAKKCDFVMYWFDGSSPESFHLLDSKELYRQLGDPHVISMSDDYPYKEQLKDKVNKWVDWYAEENFPSTIRELIEKIEEEFETWWDNLD